MTPHKTTVYFPPLHVKRLNALQDHYRNTHGLPIGTSVIVRRGLDSLCRELGVGDVVDEDARDHAKIREYVLELEAMDPDGKAPIRADIMAILEKRGLTRAALDPNAVDSTDG